MDVPWKVCKKDCRCHFTSASTSTSGRSTFHCQICNKIKRTFYCPSCVRNGDFIHSTSHFSERFAEKRSAVARVQQKKNELIAEVDKKLEVIRSRENMDEDIRLRKERIAILKSLLSETGKKLQRKKEILQRVQAYNCTGAENLQRNEECKVDTIESMNKITSKRPAIVHELELLKPQLKDLIRRRVDELVQFIFPINEIQSTKHSALSSDSQEDIKNQLAEATRTAYVRGRWVFTDSCGETQHSIVAPTLPDSGDYSPYIHWVSANKENSMTSSSSVDHNAAYNISAALTYTTQLVNLIAYYLDFRLPNRLHYSEFCTKTLSERKFIKCVMQLNANIVMLCLSQNVDPHLLQATQTLRNVVLLLNHSDLGRSEITDVATSCVSFLEEQLVNQLRAATARLSMSDLEEDDREPTWTETFCNDNDDDEDDSDQISTDWEAVPLVACPEAMPGSNTSRRQGTQSSIATGLVTSAATSFASLWRGWSNK